MICCVVIPFRARQSMRSSRKHTTKLVEVYAVLSECRNHVDVTLFRQDECHRGCCVRLTAIALTREPRGEPKARSSEPCARLVGCSVSLDGLDQEPLQDCHQSSRLATNVALSP